MFCISQKNPYIFLLYFECYPCYAFVFIYLTYLFNLFRNSFHFKPAHVPMVGIVALRIPRGVPRAPSNAGGDDDSEGDEDGDGVTGEPFPRHPGGSLWGKCKIR